MKPPNSQSAKGLTDTNPVSPAPDGVSVWMVPSVASHPLPSFLLQSHCSGSGDPGEYNLRSRTVLCGTCGQPAEKTSGGPNVGTSTMSTGSSSSSLTITRSYRSGGTNLGESLLPRSYILGSSTPRQQVSPGAPQWACLILGRKRRLCGGSPPTMSGHPLLPLLGRA